MSNGGAPRPSAWTAAAFLIVFATSRRCCPLEQSIYTRTRPSPLLSRATRHNHNRCRYCRLPPRRPGSVPAGGARAGSGTARGGNDTLTLMRARHRGGSRCTNRSRDPLSYLARHSNPVSFLFLVPHLVIRSFSSPSPTPSQRHSILSPSVNLHLGH